MMLEWSEVLPREKLAKSLQQPQPYTNIMTFRPATYTPSGKYNKYVS